MNKEESRCSFCGRSEHEVHRLIAGPNVFICNECIEVAQRILAEEKREDSMEELSLDKVPTPKEIKALLDEYVIGQDVAKKTLAVAVYNHYKRLLNQEDGSDVELQKSNVVLVGPTGSGKTLLAQTLARILNVPFAIADATSLTEAGYVGEDVENCLLKLIQAADYDISLAERGIIYIDEIDKVSRKSENPSITRDVSGEGVQQALLKILEGTVASVPPQGGRKHPQQEMLQIDTTNILFICGGAFEGIEKVISRRTAHKTIGFGADIHKKEDKDKKDIMKLAIQDDLVKFGLIPELVGRLPVLVTLDTLDEEAMIHILTQPKNALVKQYQKMLDMDHIKLTFEDGALEAIAKEALARNTGARGLRSIIERIMINVMYEAPSCKDAVECIVTEENVKKKTDPVLIVQQKEE